MPANTSPVFALSPEQRHAVIDGATTDKSGATTAEIVDLVTAVGDGTKVTRISYKHVGNSSAGTFLVFITDTAGANPRLYDEQAYAAVTSSTTVPTAGGVLTYNDLQLKAGQKIQVAATVYTTNIHVTASIGNF